MRVLGVDGCKGGWIVIALEDGAFAGSWFTASTSDLLTDAASVIGVDIPLGHEEQGPRRADLAAMRLLGPKAASVFHAPTPGALRHETYDAANHEHERATGKKIQPPAWALRHKMLDAHDSWLAATHRVFEVHPECSFAQLDGGPLSSKKSWSGHIERRAVLAQHAIHLPDDLGTGGRAQPDDVLDAAAAAWSADRIARGAAFSLPSPPERDADDRPVAIWV